MRRVEDQRLSTGRGRFTADTVPRGALYASFVRSPHACADFTIERQDGAHSDFFSQRDLDAGHLRAIPFPTTPSDCIKPPRSPLARSTARHVGDAVAVALGCSEREAFRAASLVPVRWTRLPHVSDSILAADPSSPLVHPELGSNVAFTWEARDVAVARHFEECPVRLRRQLAHPRIVAMPLEPRTVWAAPTARGLQVATSTQVPHIVRDVMAAALGIPTSAIDVVAGDVGGGFGCKLDVYPEELIVAWLAKHLGRPVCWIARRTEDIVSTSLGRGQYGVLEAAVSGEGRIRALRYEGTQDVGAYMQLNAPVMPMLTALMISGCYRVEAVDAVVRGLYTHTTPCGAYRGAGRPEATFHIETLLDDLAAELDADPIELRRRNVIPADAFPYTTPLDITFDSGDYPGALAELESISGYASLREEQQRRRARGEFVGLGVSCFVEMTGLGPSRTLATGGWTQATVSLEADGSVLVSCGLGPSGQGSETMLTLTVAEVLQVPPESIRVRLGTTVGVPHGTGTFGSRGAAVAAPAVFGAAVRLVDRAASIASSLLETTSARLVDGNFETSDGRHIGWPEIGRAAHYGAGLPQDMPLGCSASFNYDPPGFTFPHGAYLAVVSIEPTDGQVVVERLFTVDDCGNEIDPAGVDAQVAGALWQGLGAVLMEGVAFDDAGRPTGTTLRRCHIPRSTLVIPWAAHRTHTPSPLNPLGTKGVGECGTIGVVPAVFNAVRDALRPCGAVDVGLPLRAHQIWKALRSTDVNR